MTGKPPFLKIASQLSVDEVEAIEVFSALKQEIYYHLLVNAECLNLRCDHSSVITLILQLFHGFTPMRNLCLERTIQRLAREAQASRQ